MNNWKKIPAWMWALPLLALLDIAVYGGVLLRDGGGIFSRKDTDLQMGIWGLDFIFGELRHGNLPLWNPYILCGTPCFAAFQTMAFYPFAWPFMVLPPGPGCDLFIMFHVFWIGAGMFWWLSRRGLRPFSCVIGAALLMFGSTTTLKVYPGHITVLAAMSWAPFLLVVFDALLDAPRKNERRAPEISFWVLLGIGLVALQIAAGFPQHVFYTAAIGGIYFLARLLAAREYSWPQRALALAAFCAVYFGGALLMMVQLLTSWQTSKETARASAMSFKFITMCSFPPENFLTLLAPKVFGNETQLTYWGRWYSWEVTLYFGVIALVLALLGLSSTHAPARRARWLFLGCAALMIWLALGEYTPLLRFLYNHVPVFGSFRSSARALFEATIFLCALAALGFDALLRGVLAPRLTRGFALGAVACGVPLVALGAWGASENALPFWHSVFKAIGATRQYFVAHSFYSDSRLMVLAPHVAERSLMIGGLLCASAGVLLWAMKYSRRALYLLGAAAILEVAIYAFVTLPTFPFGYDSYPELEKFLKAHPGDYRFIKKDFDNLAFKWRAYDMGGYESFRLQRYDEFAQWSQGKNPDITPVLVYLEKANKSFAMLRCRFAFDENSNARVLKNPLPHVLLISKYQILPSRDAIFKRFDEKDFDPRREVILENEPPWKIPARPQPSTHAGSATVKVLDTDTLEIEASTPAPAILLITDSYSKGWRATPLPGSGAQHEYSVMPANYVLRAIPLHAGHHHILLEYSPSAFRIGKWISLAALLIYALLLARFAFTRKKFVSAHAAVGE